MMENYKHTQKLRETSTTNPGYLLHSFNNYQHFTILIESIFSFFKSQTLHFFTDKNINTAPEDKNF